MSDDLAALRRRHLAAGTWPEASVVMWRDIAADAAETRADGRPLSATHAEAEALAAAGLLGIEHAEVLT